MNCERIIYIIWERDGAEERSRPRHINNHWIRLYITYKTLVLSIVLIPSGQDIRQETEREKWTDKSSTKSWSARLFIGRCNSKGVSAAGGIHGRGAGKKIGRL